MKAKTALFAGLILTLMIPVAGMPAVSADVACFADEAQKEACEKKVEKAIKKIHEKFDEIKAKSKVMFSNSVIANSEGKTAQYFGTGFEGTFDEKCNLEDSETYT